MSKLSLGVEKAAREGAARMTGAGDLRDLRWLDERIEAINDGVEAVVDIARNWTDGRCLSRLFPGASAVEYVRSRVGPLGKGIIQPLLEESNWSNRQIAAVAGVSHQTVGRELVQMDQLPQRPAETLGADGKYRPARVIREVPAQVIEPEEDAPIARPDLWPDLERVMDAIEVLSECDAAQVATTVPDRRRLTTAKRLRKLGTYLGRIAWTLEQSEERP